MTEGKFLRTRAVPSIPVAEEVPSWVGNLSITAGDKSTSYREHSVMFYTKSGYTKG